MTERKKKNIFFKYDNQCWDDLTFLGKFVATITFITLLILVISIGCFCEKFMDIYFLKEKLIAISSVVNSPDVISVAKGTTEELSKVIIDIIDAAKGIKK